jgi:hypothetical protein
MSHGRYILKGKIPVPCEDLLTWGRWLEDSQQRVVKQEDVGPFWVSTVFLGLDHNWGDGPPLLFETMIFRDVTEADRRRRGGPKHVSVDDAPMWRTSTWELALEQHQEAVAWARERLQ